MGVRQERGEAMSATEIGTINLRNPAGYKTAISVSRRDGGQVDLHFSRAAEGEVLIILPPSIAKQLSGLLAEAALTPQKQDGAV